ncbi:MAG: DUF3575 domain-containing protein [Alistipes sp.]|nr:DUF3575 domain-containing protein [Alistipes sp.]
MACAAVLFTAVRADAQIYAKLNGLYACVGVINPQVEFGISDHSAFQTEFVYSPWASVRGRHMKFGIFMNEYRYYINNVRSKGRGFYVAADVGMMAFDITRPRLGNGKLVWFDRNYSKGYGFMLGLAVGYEYRFKERWVVDAFIGGAYMNSMYNGYLADGTINMNPHRPPGKEPDSPDPFNGSAETMPCKIGISIGYRIFNPKKQPTETTSSVL